MLIIENLYIHTKNKTIIQKINLNIKAGEIHIIMGINGSGKSTLANILIGKQDDMKVQGNIIFNNKKLLNFTINERAILGIFLGFQYPIEIPGVNNIQFIKMSLNQIRKKRNQEEFKNSYFMDLLIKNMKILDINKNFIKRGVNENFSGGEKKRNEILQMMMLNPQLCILDEIDSGLDVDALKIMTHSISYMLNNNRSFLIITHYSRLLNYINPTFVHILLNGKIIKSGNKKLAFQIEKIGYNWINK